MKAFEDYWDFTGLSEKVHYVPDAEKPEQYLVEHINLKNERREGWRAALQWTLENGQRCPVCNLEEIIKEEIDS